MKIGAYAVERDYSHYVAYAAKTVFAVVGKATKGPVGPAIPDPLALKEQSRLPMYNKRIRITTLHFQVHLPI